MVIAELLPFIVNERFQGLLGLDLVDGRRGVWSVMWRGRNNGWALTNVLWLMEGEGCGEADG